MALGLPSFKGLRPASTVSSKAKRANRDTDTRHERILRIHLWKLGLRYRKNVRTLIGKPDIVFPTAQVAVFCDGDFWHGRNWRRQRTKLKRGANGSYWTAKIVTNRARDKRVDLRLKKAGWRVLRVWETDIISDPELVASKIKEIVVSRFSPYAKSQATKPSFR